MMFWIFKDWFYRLRAAVTNTINVSVIVDGDAECDTFNAHASSVCIDGGVVIVVYPDNSVREFSLDKIQQVLVTVG